jgi:hypothetical protein
MLLLHFVPMQKPPSQSHVLAGSSWPTRTLYSGLLFQVCGSGRGSGQLEAAAGIISASFFFFYTVRYSSGRDCNRLLAYCNRRSCVHSRQTSVLHRFGIKKLKAHPGVVGVRGRSDFSRFDPRPERLHFSNFGPPAERRPGPGGGGGGVGLVAPGNPRNLSEFTPSDRDFSSKQAWCPSVHMPSGGARHTLD